jgi:nucleoside-diphosphate-sugar epimerase
MILHAASKIDAGQDFRQEVSMAKHFVANSLNRVIDRAIQVHGALGYSTDTPLAGMMQNARWARFADGADEKTVPNPINIYGEAKLTGERLTQQFNRAFGLEYAIARPSGVYGAGDIPDRVLSKFFAAAMNNRDITVHGADNRVDFTYVEDAVDGIIRCALEKQAANKIFNITAGSAINLNEAAKKIIQLTGSKSQVKDTGKNKLYPNRGTLGVSQAQKLLGYQPQHSFDQGIAKYYEWLQNKI